MAMIEVSQLTKYYGSFAALKSVDFSVDRGEILGFLGPNGAGKTTTMKILTGFLNPSEGTATVAGHNVLEDSVEVRRKIGYLPENTPLYEDLRVVDYLRYAGRLRRMGGRHLQTRIDAVVSTTSLWPKYRAPIRTLSKGYRQRVGIAQALLHEPEIIILDEPTVGLDPNQVVDVRRLIQEVGDDRTVVLCSHILSEVEATCGRVVIINQGSIVANGKPSDLKEQLGSAVSIDVSARSTGDRLLLALKSVSGITTSRIRRESEGVATVRCDVPGEATAVCERIQGALSHTGLSLVALTPNQASLEDVFRSLTKESA
ncbi:MAG TPA: ATP-binding cassette domain-containing protein [Planctomycetota bacterium]|jgi:ABC-2 type transport system ATP-binding protein|nr:ATP-binding cassette domain-containing protein [Planctomycetota bacterium]